MKHPAVTSPFIVFLFVAGCSDLGEAPKDDFVNYPGIVTGDAYGSFLILTDFPIQQTNTIYPTNLPPAFRQDGLRVVFSGNIDEKPGVDYIFPQVRLSSIRTADDYRAIRNGHWLKSTSATRCPAL